MAGSWGPLGPPEPLCQLSLLSGVPAVWGLDISLHALAECPDLCVMLMKWEGFSAVKTLSLPAGREQPRGRRASSFCSRLHINHRNMRKPYEE